MSLRIINRAQGRILLIALSLAAGITLFKLAQWQQADNALTCHCFKGPQGWGYDILVNKKIIIHQTIIPGMPGFKGFATEQQAQEVAQIVIEKIKSHREPFISHEQLQQSGIIPALNTNE